MRNLILLAVLLAASTATAQDFAPLKDARKVESSPQLADRARGLTERLLRLSPLTRNAAPPVVGKLRLAVVLVELADTPRPRFGPAAFEDLLFGKGRTKGPDGEPVAGSVRDFYAEQSGGALEIGGK